MLLELQSWTEYNGTATTPPQIKDEAVQKLKLAIFPYIIWGGGGGGGGAVSKFSICFVHQDQDCNLIQSRFIINYFHRLARLKYLDSMEHKNWTYRLVSKLTNL